MKLRHLESHLQSVEEFRNPKVNLEQYVTRPHIAARMVHTAEEGYGDISGKVVVDLGCGCGVLSIASVMMDCDYCLAVDVDQDALDTCQDNCAEFEIDTVDVVHADVNDIVSMLRAERRYIDTVLMNPPFGTKHNQGIDMKFLKVASKIAKSRIYSLHKTSTRSHVLRKAKDFGLKGEVIAELRYDLPATYKFHKVKTKDIEVDFIRFSFD